MLPSWITLYDNVNAALYRQILHSVTENNLSDYLIHQKDFIACCAGEELIGYVRIFKIEEGAYELGSLFVDPQWRRQGIGKFLISSSMRSKLPRNTSLYLACRPTLAPYYEQFGFEECGPALPEKLVFTLAWAKEHHTPLCIMKKVT